MPSVKHTYVEAVLTTVTVTNLLVFSKPHLNNVVVPLLQDDLSDDAFTSTFADTLRHLTDQAQNVPEPSPEDIASLLGNLDMEGAGPDLENLPELMPLMQGVMQKLMSKELLYPSLKVR